MGAPCTDSLQAILARQTGDETALCLCMTNCMTYYNRNKSARRHHSPTWHLALNVCSESLKALLLRWKQELPADTACKAPSTFKLASRIFVAHAVSLNPAAMSQQSFLQRHSNEVMAVAAAAAVVAMAIAYSRNSRSSVPTSNGSKVEPADSKVEPAKSKASKLKQLLSEVHLSV